MNPQFHFLRGHSFAQAASNLVSHGFPHPAAFGGHPPRKRGRDRSLFDQAELNLPQMKKGSNHAAAYNLMRVIDTA